ncbi:MULTISPECIES: immunity 22 family protein [Bacteroidota]|uniref:Immunity 22 family protein n=2 Tax=Bacteroidota TaxID=976 RepID=A0A2X2JSA7_SPHMU|nr:MULTISPECIES: immunity 22 family protein [Bacteroidota]AZB25083.1 hypothetical protein EG339_11085 [Chryseobacterium bernardetii]QRQ63173.1 immunity 22 family protein [Sphingobacterium multivorum]SPZ94956.1 Uncharacterised protein [Sphingobacterium multivorum]
MSKLHIWLGNFKSEKELEKYLDQKEYLRAWAVYDCEPPTGNEDGEPSEELRCDFCKEVDFDIYDEDAMIMKYYNESIDINTVANDILIDKRELEILCKKHKINDFNSVVAYQSNDLAEKDASGSKTVKYIGKVPQVSIEAATDVKIHYLWIGDHKIDKNNILKQAAIDKKSVVKVNYFHTAKKGKLDEVLILQIEDYNVAEKMILKVDELNLHTANSILDLIVKGAINLDGEQIGNLLNMKYIGKFDTDDLA